ncbi:hypothetical protein LMG24235_08226 [Paraburkholderia sabiae]|nr:hypothetical protein LMG24235_08226 [Paraburkholderia sabiae]
MQTNPNELSCWTQAREMGLARALRVTLGADKGYERRNSSRCHEQKVTPHVAQNNSGAAFGGDRYDCLERGLRHFPAKAQADRT